MDKMNRDITHQVPMSAEEIVAKMRAGKKEVHEIKMGPLSIPVRVLSCDEVAAVRREAIKFATIMGGDDTDKNLAIQKSTLKLASTLTKGGAPMLSDKVLALLSLDEMSYLYEEFIKVMDTVNPALEHITPEIFRMIVDALKKNTASARDLSMLQLRAICTAYVDLIQRQEIQI